MPKESDATFEKTTIVVTATAAEDEVELARMGYKQELR